jgi:hypothetical protein
MAFSIFGKIKQPTRTTLFYILIIVVILILIGLFVRFAVKKRWYCTKKQEGFDSHTVVTINETHDYTITEIIGLLLEMYDEQTYIIGELDKIKGDLSTETTKKVGDKLTTIYSNIVEGIRKSIMGKDGKGFVKIQTDILANPDLSNAEKTEKIHDIIISAFKGVNTELTKINDIKKYCTNAEELAKMVK